MLRPAVVLASLSLMVGGCAAEDGAPEGTAGGVSALGEVGELGADAYRAYGDLAKEAGAAPSAGTVTVLGLRGLAIDGTTHATSYVRAFDDTLVVLRADGTVDRFAGSTHPFERGGVPGVPDVDGDRIADVGMIRPGIYDVTGRERAIAGAASYAVSQRSSGALPGWRDTDHDGVLSEAERAASERRDDRITDVLFHSGEGSAPPAVGCQVLPASSIGAFTASVGGRRARFRYLLLDMKGRDMRLLPR